MSDPCAQGLCNIRSIQQALDGVREGSPSWRRMQPPEVPEASLVGPGVAVALGLLIASSAAGGLVLAGLLIAAGGVAHGVRRQRMREDAEQALAEWTRSRWCLACDQRRGPGWAPPREVA